MRQDKSIQLLVDRTEKTLEIIKFVGDNFSDAKFFLGTANSIFGYEYLFRSKLANTFCNKAKFIHSYNGIGMQPYYELDHNGENIIIYGIPTTITLAAMEHNYTAKNLPKEVIRFINFKPRLLLLHKI